LELDGGTVKVSVGSIIESQGSLYKVDTAAVTPTGTATAGAYLFFDDAVPGFVWSVTPGTYDPARGGIYDASDRRQCRFYLTSGTEWLRVVADEGDDIRHEGALTVEGLFKPVNGWQPQNILHNNNASENVIFDTLSPFIPNIGDTIAINGSFMDTAGGAVFVASYAERESASLIRIYVNQDSSGIAGLAINDGDISNSYEVSIIW
jgi:hypothetical protein